MLAIMNKLIKNQEYKIELGYPTTINLPLECSAESGDNPGGSG